MGFFRMGLTPRLEVRQSQNLTLTPQLMQSIRLLQLSHLELNTFVEAELLRNPLLEREDGTEAGDADGAELPERPAELSAYEDTAAGSRMVAMRPISTSSLPRGRRSPTTWACRSGSSS